MKKIPAVLVLLLYAGLCRCQSIDLNDLVDYTNWDIQKFDAHLGRKSFKRDYNSPKETQANYNYYQKKKIKGEEVVRKFSYQQGNDPVICYQTSSEKEYNSLKKEILHEGFHCYDNDPNDTKPLLFQKNAWTISTSREIIDSTTLYTLVVNKIPVPKIKDITYAEDLLNFKSHEALVNAFGSSNVTMDLFRFSESETNRCSVLFPNTSREVIFIWEDEVNYRKISFLLIGKHAETTGTANFTRQVIQNEWQSKQGVFQGMTLKELQDLNGSNLQFYGWASEQPGVLAQTNQGKIDFKKLGIVLNCLNCSGNKVYNTSLVNSDNAIADERKVYVSAMIILPEKDKSAVASR
jgi:hypothetical protein